PAFSLEPIGQLGIEQGVEHNPRRGLDFGEHAIKLLFAAHQRVDVLDRGDGRILCGSRTRDRNQGLAGRVRDEGKVEVARGARRHRLGCGKPCELGPKRPRPALKRKRRGGDGSSCRLPDSHGWHWGKGREAKMDLHPSLGTEQAWPSAKTIYPGNPIAWKRKKQ